MKSKWNISNSDWERIASSSYTDGGAINKAYRTLKEELDDIKARRPCVYNRTLKIVERR